MFIALIQLKGIGLCMIFGVIFIKISRICLHDHVESHLALLLCSHLSLSTVFCVAGLSALQVRLLGGHLGFFPILGLQR